MTEPTEHREGDWHYLDWTPERVAAFWDFTAHWPAHHEDYFTRQVGKGVIRFARARMPFAQEVVDFGCGIGDLIECLLAEGVPCRGVDSSPTSVRSVNERFAGRPGWKGASVASGEHADLPDHSVGTMFFVETIEHIQPDLLSPILKELHRLLVPETGRLMVTTPNDEHLPRHQIFCPSCRSVFHRYQHVRSFNRESLTEVMESAGFTTIECDATSFGRYMADPVVPRRRSLLDISLRDVGRRIRRLVSSPSRDSEPIQAPATPEPHRYWIGFAAKPPLEAGP